MEFKNIFVVFDPTREEQPALNRGAQLALETGRSLHVYACIFSDSANQEEVRARVELQDEQLKSRIEPLLEAGLLVATEVDWDKDWYQAVVRASIRNSADVLLKSSYRHTPSQRILNRTSDWTLIRECLCPVMLVKEGTDVDSRNVLAAIDIRPEKAAYEHLNQRIIDFSQRVMEHTGAEVHFINAHRDLDSSPDRNALIRNCGVQSDRIHIRMGEPEDVIVENARELNAALVIIGNSARSGLSALINGNTVEKIVDKLECDILSMPG